MTKTDGNKSAYAWYCAAVSGQSNLLSKEETTSLCLLSQQGNIEARNKVVCAYTHLVVLLVNRQFSKFDDQIKSDLIQVGNEALIRAIDKFDPEKASFVTYAENRIKIEMITYLNSYHHALAPLKFPYNLAFLLYKFLKLTKKPDFDIHDTEYLCRELGINSSQLSKILHAYNQRPISSNIPSMPERPYTIEASLEEPDNNIEASICKMDDVILLSQIKMMLPNYYYYIIYECVFSDKPCNYTRTGKELGVVKECVRSTFLKIIASLEKLISNERMQIEYSKMAKNKIRQNGATSLNLNPVTPTQICLYLFLKDFLGEIERDLLYIIYFSGLTYSLEQLAQKFNLDISELKELMDSLFTKIEVIANSERFKKYAEKLKAKYKTKIFRLIDRQTKKDFDYGYLINTYLNNSLEHLIDILSESGFINLDTDAIKRGYSLADKVLVNKAYFQNEISVLTNRNSFMSKLYNAYLMNKHVFNVAECSFLETSFFQVKGGDKLNISDEEKQRIITKLVSINYQINDFVFYRSLFLDNLSFFKKYLTKEEMNILQLYFRHFYIEGPNYGIDPLANYFGKEANEMGEILETLLLRLKELINYRNGRNYYNTTYLERHFDSNQCNIDNQKLEIAKSFIVDNSPIAMLANKYHLTPEEIISIINEIIYQIDLKRFKLTADTRINKQLFQDFLNNNQVLSDFDKGILELVFIKQLSFKEICQKTNCDINYLKELISKAIDLYVLYIDDNAALSRTDYIMEFNKPKIGSVLTEKEKEFIKYYFISLDSIEDIKLKMHCTEEDINNIHKVIACKIRARKYGYLNGFLYFIPIHQLSPILKDSNLPLNRDEKDIICHLYGFDCECISLEELAKEYNLSYTQMYDKYLSIIIIILKYQRREISNKRIDYSTAAMFIQYFSEFERKLLYDLYQLKLSIRGIMQKYDIPEDRLKAIITNLEFKTRAIINNDGYELIDFDYYKMYKNQLGSSEIALTIFELYYGTNGNYPISMSEIIKKLNIGFEEGYMLLENVKVKLFNHKNHNLSFDIKQIDIDYIDTKTIKEEDKKLLSDEALECLSALCDPDFKYLMNVIGQLDLARTLSGSTPTMPGNNLTRKLEP